MEGTYGTVTHSNLFLQSRGARGGTVAPSNLSPQLMEGTYGTVTPSNILLYSKKQLKH